MKFLSSQPGLSASTRAVKESGKYHIFEERNCILKPVREAVIADDINLAGASAGFAAGCMAPKCAQGLNGPRCGSRCLTFYSLFSVSHPHHTAGSEHRPLH